MELEPFGDQPERQGTNSSGLGFTMNSPSHQLDTTTTPLSKNG
jgi:hypothetical protein